MTSTTASDTLYVETQSLHSFPSQIDTKRMPLHYARNDVQPETGKLEVE